ncbi:hypothetical protein EC917_112160 [Bacillus thuringiensis]|uniref:Uncharacterized protein n=2 Tax=Bacillus thuringiensis TaxID=1428 RepID=A0A4R4BC06_BACTU|nr:hypothetical protein EC917_112160 [Bacillus thuringiensis]TCW53207.1 hypothetical protein EC910_112160 [Bacillus thuringiensis]
MHLYTPIDWVPTLVLNQDVKADPVSFTIHKACFMKGTPEYNEVGMGVWKSVLQVSLDDHGEFWNALKTFLHIQVLSVLELEQVIKVNEIR